MFCTPNPFSSLIRPCATDCLNSLFFSELHARRDRVSDPQIDTDQWIWEHHAYRKWLEKRSSILWIQGKPGSGKSTLMRMIQKTLLSKSKASLNESQTGMRDSIVADFFYSARGVSNETSHRLMLQSLLYQVLEQEPYVFKVFKCQFRRLLGESTGRVEWPYDDLKTILLSLPHSNILDKPWTSRCKIYFLLDAMDESEYGLRRIEVLSLLSGLCSTSGEIIIKIIIASRPANEIEKKLKGFHHIELQKENAADIEKVVDAGLRLMWESMNENDDDSQTSSDGNESGGDSDSSSDRDDLPAKISREASGQQDQSSRIAVGVSNDDMNDTIYQEALEFVGKYLIQSADGVILWVVLILGELLRYVEKGSHSRNEIKEKLEDLPTDLVSIYKEIVDTLQKGHNEKEMAQGRLMLTWGSFAKRPLTVKELRDVIAIPAGAQSIFRWSTSILHDNRISIQHNNWAPIRSRMVDMCGGFLEAVPPNSESSIKIHSKTRKMKSTYVVQLLHQTVKDFLLHNNSAIPFNLDETDCQCLIAAALLRYLTLSLPMENLQTKLIQEWDQEEYREFVEYLLDRPLLGYVLAFLPQHIRDSGVNVTGLELTRFLQQLRCKPEHHAWAFLDGWCCVELLPSAPSTTSPLAESFRTGCLMAASEAGHTEIVRVMVDLMGKNANCKTALHGAASNGHEAVVRLLLEKGSVVEAKGKGGGTALHEAASNRHETVVRLLLEKGANIEAKDNDGKTALHWAARNGHEAVVRVLLEHKADVDAQGGTESYVQTALYWAARNGHEAVVHLLLKANAKVDTRVGFNGWTALCEAADVGHVAVVQLLLEANADVDAKGGPYKWTALHQAADNGHEAVVRLLLEANAEVDAKGGFNGWTALCGASRNGHETVVRLLLEAKADVGAKEGFYGQTALHRAAWNGHEAVVWLLLKAKADVDAMEGFYRWTPLHWAAWNGHEAVVRLLLEAEAEVDTKGEFNGWTALHWAARNGHEAVVRLLLEFKADVDTKDNNGETALYWAARSGHEAVVRLL